MPRKPEVEYHHMERLVTTIKGDMFMTPKAHELTTVNVSRVLQSRMVQVVGRRVVRIVIFGTMTGILTATNGCVAGRPSCGGCKLRNRLAIAHNVQCDPVGKGCARRESCVGDGRSDFDDSLVPSKTPEPSADSMAGGYGHGENYEWLIGRLQKVHVPREGWKIRYLPLDKKDRWGGSVVLAPDIRIEEYNEGDKVYIEGTILSNRASLYLSGPRYRFSTIRRMNAGDNSHLSR